MLKPESATARSERYGCESSLLRARMGRAGLSLYSRARFREPASVQHLFCTSSVDMRANQRFERIRNLPIFVVTALGSLFRQIPLGDKVAEERRIGAVRYA